MKKMLMTALAVVLIVVISVSATLAYLTSEAEVTNTFTVGQVDIKLDEATVDPETGKAIDDKPRTETGNADVKIIPGRPIDKDPTVTVLNDSEPCYVRMKVTISKISELKAIFGADFLPQNYVTGWDADTWVSTKVIAEDADANTATYEFRYKEVVDTRDAEEEELPALFTTFTLPGDKVDNTQLATLKGLNITVFAEAIQSESFADADAAWAAFSA